MGKSEKTPLFYICQSTPAATTSPKPVRSHIPATLARPPPPMHPRHPKLHHGGDRQLSQLEVIIIRNRSCAKCSHTPSSSTVCSRLIRVKQACSVVLVAYNTSTVKEETLIQNIWIPLVIVTDNVEDLAPDNKVGRMIPLVRCPAPFADAHFPGIEGCCSW